jgi:hypothetical protein
MDDRFSTKQYSHDTEDRAHKWQKDMVMSESLYVIVPVERVDYQDPAVQHKGIGLKLLVRNFTSRNNKFGQQSRETIDKTTKDS